MKVCSIRIEPKTGPRKRGRPRKEPFEPSVEKPARKSRVSEPVPLTQDAISKFFRCSNKTPASPVASQVVPSSQSQAPIPSVLHIGYTSVPVDADVFELHDTFLPTQLQRVFKKIADARVPRAMVAGELVDLLCQDIYNRVTAEVAEKYELVSVVTRDAYFQRTRSSCDPFACQSTTFSWRTALLIFFSSIRTLDTSNVNETRTFVKYLDWDTRFKTRQNIFSHPRATTVPS